MNEQTFKPGALVKQVLIVSKPVLCSLCLFILAVLYLFPFWSLILAKPFGKWPTVNVWEQLFVWI